MHLLITFVDARLAVKHAGAAATNRTSAVAVTVMEVDHQYSCSTQDATI